MQLFKLFNGFLGEFAYNNRIAGSINSPTIFTIETTNVCNLNCIMCPRREMTRKMGIMDLGFFKKIVDQAKPYNRWILLHGMGEPLTDKHIFEMIDYCESNGIKVELSTNCTLLDKENAKKLLKTKLSRLILSVDAVTEGTYKKIRRQGDFNKVMENINNFLEMKKESRSKTEIVLQLIVMKENKKEINDFVGKWQGKVSKVLVKPFSSWAGQLSEIGELGEEGYRYQNAVPKTRPACYYLWKSVVVQWDGKVVPCCRDFNSKIVLGDLKEQTLAEIWKGKKIKAMRKAHLEGRFKNTLCDNCYDISTISPKKFYPFNGAFLKQITKK